MSTAEKITLKPDSKGRIALGKLLNGVSSVHAYVDDENRIILIPFKEIPLTELTEKEAESILKEMLSQVTKESLHDEISTGDKVGHEEW